MAQDQDLAQDVDQLRQALDKARAENRRLEASNTNLKACVGLTAVTALFVWMLK